jgi:hypothetical protein
MCLIFGGHSWRLRAVYKRDLLFYLQGLYICVQRFAEINPYEGGTVFLRNFCVNLQHYMARIPRRLELEKFPLFLRG